MTRRIPLQLLRDASRPCVGCNLNTSPYDLLVLRARILPSSSSHSRRYLFPLSLLLLLGVFPSPCRGAVAADTFAVSTHAWELVAAFVIALLASVLISRFIARRITALAESRRARQAASTAGTKDHEAVPHRPHEMPDAALHYTALTELMRMIAKAIDERTSYLRGHSERVAIYSAAIARELRMDPAIVERIRLSALLHDIGTIGIEDSLVRKDAPLTPEEFEIVKAHTVKGASILRPIEALNDLIPGVELHHESLDGMGYPHGLKRDEIPMMARIISVADSFDAMTTTRPYQRAMDPDYVLEVMNRLAGIRYDESAVAALTELVQQGILVVKKPRVQPLLDPNSDPNSQPSKAV